MTRAEISALADRLAARAASRLMNTTPELQGDLRVASLVIRYALLVGFPVSPIELEG